MKRFSSNARTLQWIDRRVGAPLCWFLTQVRRVGGLIQGAPPAPVRRILFLKLAEQGSTVLAYEAVRLACERVGRENVYFLCFEENRFVVDLVGLVPPDNVVTVATRTPGSMIRGAFQAIRRVRSLGIDACIDMEFFARFSAAIAYLLGARRRVGFHVYFGEGPYRGDLMTHRVLYNPHLHTSRTFTSLVLALDFPPAAFPTLPVAPPECRPLPAFVPGREETAAVRTKLEALGVPAAGRLVVLNANAGDMLPLRRWALANYRDLASRLLSEFPDAWVVFTGSAEEAPGIAELAGSVGSGRSVCLAGQTTLRELVVLFGMAEILVTNDSGPAHFAALTAVDVVALFGPETPLLYSAPGPRSHPVWAGIACSPCVNAFNNRQTSCRDNVCMKAITVDQVHGVASRIFRERTGCSQGPAS